jgi:regulator of protease activity HflC (stomatin/prohibitin superfamily)
MATEDLDNPAGPGPATPARQASVTLRTRGQGDDSATQLDPANQSLAEALGLVFRLLQLAMIVLFAVFAFSGFQSVKENESGIRLLFGKASGERLTPGPQFSAPYPLGELIKVDMGAARLDIDEAFWPRLNEQQRRQTPAQLAGQGRFQLKPGEDGSLITADENLVHTKWQAIYQRRDPESYIRNIAPEAERQIVQAAIQRGVVRAIAQVQIDPFLRQTSEQAMVVHRARELAQATLDEIESGIQIERLILEERIPPLFVLQDFAGVQSAEQGALKARIEAETEAQRRLSSMAGGAYEHLIEQIDLYEAAVTRGDTQEQESILATVHALMTGRGVEINGETVANLASGQITAILNEAGRYRSSIVSQRQGELAMFQAKLAGYRLNPEVVIQGDWASAMTVFLDRDIVEIFHLPPGTESPEVWINRDIAHQRVADRLRKERETREQEQRRMREIEQLRFRTNTDSQTVTDM